MSEQPWNLRIDPQYEILPNCPNCRVLLQRLRESQNLVSRLIAQVPAQTTTSTVISEEIYDSEQLKWTLEKDSENLERQLTAQVPAATTTVSEERSYPPQGWKWMLEKDSLL